MRIVRAIVAGLCAVVLLAAPAPAASTTPDPGASGPYSTVSGEYDLPPVAIPDVQEPSEMRALVVAPRNVSGSAPLVVFLHGFHEVCWNGDETGLLWPCPAGFSAVPSYRGYHAIQQHLASWGYVTVSLSANAINAFAYQDNAEQARSSLIRLHLSRWADWSGAGRGQAPEAVRAAPPVDLSRVLLIGHSRGGDGVNRAAMDSVVPPSAEVDGAPGPARWRIRGTVLLGASSVSRNPVSDVPSMSFLPGCDRDAAELQTQVYVDGTRGVGQGVALHSAVFLPGANHNFFNSEWTPGEAAAPARDDVTSTTDPLCSPGAPSRLTAAQQRAAAAAYFVAGARLFLNGDDQMRPFLDGSVARAPALSHALGGFRSPLLVPAAGVGVSGDGTLCRLTSCDLEASPHVLTGDPGVRYAVSVSWSTAGRPVLLRPAQPTKITGATTLAMRVVVPPNTSSTTFDVAVSDRTGRRSVLGTVRLDGLPGSPLTRSAWAQEVRVPLPSAVDRAGITALELTPRSASGRLWLLDAWGWRPGTPDPGTPVPVRVDLLDGDDSVGAAQLTVPLRVAGAGTGEVLLSVRKSSVTVATQVVTVRPGDSAVEVPVGALSSGKYVVTATATRNTVAGDVNGDINVR
ncbi:hypothetical protein [Actinoplanes sp. NPDC089786]|uniref:hypothetical protein n=1 Tax=Actinoplanes sp. NPDC089786 TaxID=3155185 RepID=UPI003425E606